MKLELENKGYEPWEKELDFNQNSVAEIFDDLNLKESLKIKFSVFPSERDVWTVETQIIGMQELECARTLEPVMHPIDLSFTVVANKVAGIKEQQFNDEEDEFFEIDIPQAQNFVDFSECVRQMVILNEPINPLKDPEASFNWEDPEQEKDSEAVDPRWEKLKEWKPKV
ncbi:MAG: DUF177 domain-containing protein [Fibrobacter sp.]|nr:DUF177 domain-containing protein [Fibrobacter sp.]